MKANNDFQKAEEMFLELWKTVEQERGHLLQSEIKGLFICLFFYKYICTYSIIKSKRTAGDTKAYQNRFNIPEDCHFDTLYKERLSPSFNERLSSALYHLEKINDNKLTGVFSTLFGKNGRGGGPVLCSLFEAFNLFDFSRIITDNSLPLCFELLLEKFGQAGLKSGEEFETPLKVTELLKSILQPLMSATIYDPASGYGSLLIHLVSQFKTGNKIFSQEVNAYAYAICKINLIIHGFDNANLALGDTLLYPAFKNKQFDIVVSNPPFNSNQKSLKYSDIDPGRFPWGMPPDSRADYAFLSHMLLSAKEKTGKVGLLATHSMLFRQGQEQIIRKNIIKDGLLDAVIGLPSNLFAYTGIPVVVLIFDKARKLGDKILFIDASKYFAQERRRNILTDDAIKLISNAYHHFKRGKLMHEEFWECCYTATEDEILANDCNLIPTRYVKTSAIEEHIDAALLKSEIKLLDAKIEQIRNEINKHLKSLGL